MNIPEQTVMVFIIKNDHILLSRRLNTWFGNNQFSVPGGLVDSGETPQQAAVREVKEETNIDTQEDDMHLFHQSQATHKDRVFENHYYVTHSCTGELLNNEPDRHMELNWYPLSALPSDTMPLIVQLLARI